MTLATFDRLAPKLTTGLGALGLLVEVAFNLALKSLFKI